MASMTSTLCSLSHVHNTRVTKATPIHFIDGKCDIKKLKWKSSKLGLTNHAGPIYILHHWLLIPSRRTHTHAYRSHGQKQFQETRCVSGSKIMQKCRINIEYHSA